MLEIRFHGRGGQGAVTAAELLAQAVFLEGKYPQSFPVFGSERRGAPVASFCRIDDKPITIHQEIYEPDITVVLEGNLLTSGVNVCGGIKKGGIAIVNSHRAPDELGLCADNVYAVDATDIALKTIGKPIVNTAMLGALAKVTGVCSLDSLKKAIDKRFPPKLAEPNKQAVQLCYEAVKS